MRNFLLIIITLTYLGVASLSYSKVEDVVVNFDTYESADLNGQDGWSDAWNSLIAEESITAQNGEGKALKSHAHFGGIGFRTIPQEFYENGGARIKFRAHNNDFSDDQQIISLFKKNTQEFIASVRFTNGFNTLNNTLLASESSTEDPEVLGGIDQDSWHTIALEWNMSDHTVRAHVDDQPWTEWFSPQAGWSTDDDVGVMLSLPQTSGYGNLYLDDLEVYIPQGMNQDLQDNNIIDVVVEKVVDTLSDIVDVLTGADEEISTSDTASSTPQIVDTLSEATSSQDTLVSTPSTTTSGDTSTSSAALDTISDSMPTPEPEIETVAAPLAPEEVSTTTVTF